MSYFPLLYWNSHVFTCHCLLILCLYLSWGVLCLQTYNVLGNPVCFSLWAQHFQINWRIRKRGRKVCLNEKGPQVRAHRQCTSEVISLWSVHLQNFCKQSECFLRYQKLCCACFSYGESLKPKLPPFCVLVSVCENIMSLHLFVKEDKSLTVVMFTTRVLFFS